MPEHHLCLGFIATMHVTASACFGDGARKHMNIPGLSDTLLTLLAYSPGTMLRPMAYVCTLMIIHNGPRGCGMFMSFGHLCTNSLLPGR